MNLKEIGGYQVIEMVGEGGQGAVYRAQDPSSGQIVAIKVLARSASDGEFLDRFQREASIMATIQHPNVVEVYDHGEEEGQHYIVTEFVTENLERILERGGTLPLQRAITVVQQIASALQVSHNAGITHRDIKPANVLLNDAGEVKLTDFGIASAETLDSMTSENTTVGTPLYMSPEQIQGSDAIDGRSDLYSLGCLLYEVLTGATPFQGKSTFEIFNGHINEAHEPIASHMDEFPEQLEELLVKSLTKDREQRYQTADDMINDLQEIATILAEGPQDVARTRVMPKVLATQVLDKPNTTGSSTTGGGGMPKWLMPAGAVVALLVIIGGAGFFFMGQGSGAVGLATGIAADVADPNWATGVVADPEGVVKATSDLSITFAENPVGAVTAINQIDDLDPVFAGTVLSGIHNENQALGAQFLLSIGAADPARLEGLLSTMTASDAVGAGIIFTSLINENTPEIAAFLEDAIEGPNSDSLKRMFVESAKNDDIAISQLVNQVVTSPGGEMSTANALLAVAYEDTTIASEIVGVTSAETTAIWQAFIAIDPTIGGEVFVKANANGYGQQVIDKIVALAEADNYVSGILVAHMAKADAVETAPIYSALIEDGSGDLGSKVKNAIVHGAVWDYQAVEDMLVIDDAFVSRFSDRVHPQIWTKMDVPMAGDGEEGKGVWTRPLVESTSIIDFTSVTIKSLNSSDVSSGNVIITDVTPPVLDPRSDRNVLTYVQVETDGFMENGLTSLISFNIPKSNFATNQDGTWSGHAWSVEFSRFDEASQSWAPVVANTVSEDQDNVSFAVPISGFSQYGTSIWSVSTDETVISGSQLSIDQIDVTPLGDGEVSVTATVTNRSPNSVIRDLSLIIDGTPEYSTTVAVESQSIVQVSTDLFMEAGMRGIALGNYLTSYENLRVAGTSSSDTGISGSDLASFGVDCPSEEEISDNELEYGSEVDSKIDCGGDIDPWTFYGRAGELVTIRMMAGSGSELDAAIDLVNPNDKVVKSDDDSSEALTPPSNGIDSEITSYELRYTGTYSILSKGGGTGSYTLEIIGSDSAAPEPPASPVLSSTSDTGTQGDGVTNRTVGVFFDIERSSNLGEKPNIRLYRGNDIEIGTCDADDYQGTCTIEVNGLSEGEHSIYAKAQNQMGVFSEASTPALIVIDTQIDTPSIPDLTVDSDTGKRNDDDLTNDVQPTFSGTGEPGATVKIFDSSANELGSDNVSSLGLWTVEANDGRLPHGTHLIYAQITDIAGNESDLSEALEITVDLEAPDRMSAPVPNNQGEISGKISISGDIDLINLFSNGEYIGNTRTQSNGDWVFSMEDLPGGENILTLTATDMAGNESEMSNTKTVTMDVRSGQGPQGGQGNRPNEAPIIDAMFGNNPNNNMWEETRDTDDPFPEFRGWGEPYMDIVLRADGNRIGESIVQGDGSWTIYPDREMREGDYRITAEQIDPSTGLVGPPSKDFWIDIHPPGSGNVMTPTTPQAYWYDNNGRQLSGTDVPDSDTLWFQGYADPNVYVVLISRSEQIGDTYSDQNGSWYIETYDRLEAGYHEINAYSESDNGMQSSWSQTAYINIGAGGGDMKPPVVEGLLYYDSFGNTILSDTTVAGYVGFQGYSQPNVEVHVKLDGDELAHAQVMQDGRWEAWSNYMLKPGYYELIAVARDWNTGAEVESDPFYIEITDVETPTVYGVRDEWGDWSTVHDASIVGPMMIGGSAAPNMRIEVFVDGELIADSGTDAYMDEWEIGPTPAACFPPGEYKVSAIGYANGTVASDASDPVWVTVIGDGSQMCDMMKNMMGDSTMMQGMMGDMGGMMGNMGGGNFGGNDMHNGGNMGGGNFGGNDMYNSGNMGGGNMGGGNMGGGSFR